MPDYVNVNTIAELKGRAAEFDGRIVGIEAGAGEMKAMREQIIPKYGLTDFNLVEGSSPVMLATLDSAIKQQQPVVVTLWQPHCSQIVEFCADDQPPPPPVPILGHVTSSYRSAELERPFALALVRGGRARIGDTVHVPVDGAPVPVEVTGSVLVDPEGARRDG